MKTDTAPVDPAFDNHIRLLSAAPDLLSALKEMTSAGEYCIDLMHSAANPKSMDKVDWKGIALHMYASLNVVSAARAAIAKAEGHS
jgi:hypothetical protein